MRNPTLAFRSLLKTPLVTGVAILSLALGGLIGLTFAIGIGRAARSLLFQVEGFDPAVIMFAAAVLALVAFGAGFPSPNSSRNQHVR